MHAARMLGRQQGAILPVSRPQQVKAAPSRAAQQPWQRQRCGCHVLTAARKQYEILREAVPGNNVKLTITVPGVVCQQSFTTIVDRLRKEVIGELPGYQTDKIPLALVMQHTGGKRNFDMAVLEEVLLRAMADIVPLQSDLLPNSEQITSDVRALLAGFDPSKPLTFEVKYTPLPPITWSSPYTDIQVEVPDNGSLETDVAAAEDLIQQYLKTKAQQRVVGDRGLLPGDLAICSLRVLPKGGRTPYPGLDKDKFAFDTAVDKLGLTERMVGMLPGETRTWDFTFPPDWEVELWQGQAATATVQVFELFSYILPEFTDEWVSQHYPQFQSAADMREALTSATTVERLRALEEEVRDALIDGVVSRVSSPVPPRYLELVADKEFQEQLLGLVAKGVARPEDLEEQYNEEGLQRYMAAEGDALVNTCKWLLAANAIAEEQQLEVSEDALELEVEAAAKDMPEGFDATSYRQDMREKLKMALVMEWLQKNSKVNITPWAGEGAAASAAASAAAGAAATGGAAAAAGGGS